MGNCLVSRRDSRVEWCGDELGSFGTDENTRIPRGSATATDKASSAPPSTEVKIKISKRQLEKLVSKADGKGLSAEELLTMLVGAADQSEAHQRTWKPDLNSIAE